jgi:serine/threonine protein kinase
MATLSVESFIDYVERSELVEAGTLQTALDDFKGAHGGELPSDSDILANFLIDRKLLTSWHVEKLMDKKYRGFALGKYRMLRLIGSGGMSTVYLAQHKLLNIQRAIKVLPKKRVKDSSYLQRFHLEAQATSQLDHPNIVRCYDVDNEGDTHYIVMEFIEGKDLNTIVKQEPQELKIQVCRQVARILLYTLFELGRQLRGTPDRNRRRDRDRRGFRIVNRSRGIRPDCILVDPRQSWVCRQRRGFHRD